MTRGFEQPGSLLTCTLVAAESLVVLPFALTVLGPPCQQAWFTALHDQLLQLWQLTQLPQHAGNLQGVHRIKTSRNIPSQINGVHVKMQ